MSVAMLDLDAATVHVNATLSGRGCAGVQIQPRTKTVVLPTA